ncbi:hypothetical protein [Angustibacter luteus]|uniref:hypothetical protein n=1 Tax=Angustibacter luteus TaxID=658456 RepID=UPI0031EE17B0
MATPPSGGAGSCIVEHDRARSSWSASQQAQPELDLLGVPTSLALLLAGTGQPQDVQAESLTFSVGEPLVEMGTSQVFMHELLHLSTPE